MGYAILEVSKVVFRGAERKIELRPTSPVREIADTSTRARARSRAIIHPIRDEIAGLKIGNEDGPSGIAQEVQSQDEEESEEEEKDLSEIEESEDKDSEDEDEDDEERKTREEYDFSEENDEEDSDTGPEEDIILFKYNV